jgi:hypothetical protein
LDSRSKHPHINKVWKPCKGEKLGFDCSHKMDKKDI